MPDKRLPSPRHTPYARNIGSAIPDLPLVEENESSKSGITNELDHAKILAFAKEFAESSKGDISVSIPSKEALTSNLDFYGQIIESASREPRPEIRILIPLVESDLEVKELLQGLEWRRAPSTDIGFCMFDGKRMIQTETRSNIVSAKVVTNELFVTTCLAIFNALWRETELRETGDVARKELLQALAREEKARREAQLLQDILAHDIRNYNQVAKLSAELINEELKGNNNVKEMVNSMLQAVNGSTDLLERAKRLGKVFSEHDPKLFTVNLLEVIDTSIKVVREAHPEKNIAFKRGINHVPPKNEDRWKRHPQQAFSFTGAHECNVLADDLLHEVFVNLFTNAVKYTKTDPVNIEVLVEEEVEKLTPDPIDTERDIRLGGNSSLKVSVIDHGRGILDSDKNRIFSRYLRGAMGTGLGMSIVHALVVDRYGGKILVKNRVETDYSEGTVVEVFLKREK